MQSENCVDLRNANTRKSRHGINNANNVHENIYNHFLLYIRNENSTEFNSLNPIKFYEMHMIHWDIAIR